MKARIIAIASGLAILFLGVFAVVIIKTNFTMATGAVVLSLVPMYFLYVTVVLGKYDKAKNRNMTPKKRIESMLKPSEYAETNDQYWKRINKEKPYDLGKVLEFDKDKKTKQDPKNED